jgi:hypothetical protein
MASAPPSEGNPNDPIAMKTSVTPNAFRRAVYPTLCVSLPALIGVCTLMFGLKEGLKLAASYPIQIAVGYAAMVLFIEFVGIPRRARLHRFGTGILFAIALFITGVLSGSASSMLLYRDLDFVSYVIGPLFWMGFYGVLPAAVFGVIGAGVLRMTHKEA